MFNSFYISRLHFIQTLDMNLSIRGNRIRPRKCRKKNTVKNDKLDWKMICANRLCHNGKDLIPLIEKVCDYYNIKCKRNRKVGTNKIIYEKLHCIIYWCGYNLKYILYRG